MSQKKRGCARRNIVQSQFCFVSFDLQSQPASDLYGAVVLQVWSAKQCRHHLGAAGNAVSDPNQTHWLRNSEGGPSNLCSHESSEWSWFMLKFENCWAGARGNLQIVRLPRKVRPLVAKHYLQKPLGGNLSWNQIKPLQSSIFCRLEAFS